MGGNTGVNGIKKKKTDKILYQIKYKQIHAKPLIFRGNLGYDS